MFGYIKTDLPNMYIKDTVLYQAMYCSLCKGIGQTCGQKARFVLNYDLTFLSVLLHNVADVDVKVEKQHCVIHRLRHCRSGMGALPSGLGRDFNILPEHTGKLFSR